MNRESYSSFDLVFNEGGSLMNDTICKEPNNSAGVVRCCLFYTSFSSYKYPDDNHANANIAFLCLLFVYFQFFCMMLLRFVFKFLSRD